MSHLYIMKRVDFQCPFCTKSWSFDEISPDVGILDVWLQRRIVLSIQTEVNMCLEAMAKIIQQF